jgi:microcystin-dependent protein
MSEIKIVSFNFPPKGWALCNGQFLPINQNQALFSLLGTTYGGNGQTTFALPNLRDEYRFTWAADTHSVKQPARPRLRSTSNSCRRTPRINGYKQRCGRR